mmetsp:Transcript_19699/g.49911  ORF Transcript_19699/g.49911 Transcript_19699/m.49911 type:complete len:201 (-) Transcript_19699:583-1185(-)
MEDGIKLLPRRHLALQGRQPLPETRTLLLKLLAAILRLARPLQFGLDLGELAPQASDVPVKLHVLVLLLLQRFLCRLKPVLQNAHSLTLPVGRLAPQLGLEHAALLPGLPQLLLGLGRPTISIGSAVFRNLQASFGRAKLRLQGLHVLLYLFLAARCPSQLLVLLHGVSQLRFERHHPTPGLVQGLAVFKFLISRLLCRL